MFNPFSKSTRHRRESAMGTAVLGGLMVITSIPTLFINEGRAVKTARALAEGAAAVMSVDPDQLDPMNEGKLVHLSGRTITNQTLSDDRFGVKVRAIRLIRSAEMFQWQEVEQKVTRNVNGKSKTETQYEYERGWDSKLHPSSGFREPESHQNPAVLRFESKVIEANEVLVGKFRLPGPLVQEIKDEETLDEAQSQNAALTWALCFAGSIGLIVGIGLVMRPLTAIADRIPVVGNLVGMGAALVAILLGGATAILTISAAWLIYRPLIAIPMLSIGIGILVMLVKLSKRKPHEPFAIGNLKNA